MTIELFIPAGVDADGLDNMETFIETCSRLRPDITIEQHERAWAYFAEMRARVAHPDRRRSFARQFRRIPGSVTLVPDPLPYPLEGS